LRKSGAFAFERMNTEYALYILIDSERTYQSWTQAQCIEQALMDKEFRRLMQRDEVDE
jgi:hypothetical protein